MILKKQILNLHTRILFVLITTLLVFLFSCKKDINENKYEDQTKTINGKVQKGPYLSGSSINLFELTANYVQTGKVYSTQITNNFGSFDLSGVPAGLNYGLIKADGFYFNEVCGNNSSSQLTLYCISDLSNVTSIHVNVLTELEKQRVEYLLGTGLSFNNAKTQAQTDVLNIFGFPSTGIQSSENLDVSNGGNGNAILLAASSILQGFRTESELSLLLSTIANDIKTDGILNDSVTKSSLIDHALFLDTVSIRNNITNYYTSLGLSPTIDHFETYIMQFINTTTFAPTNTVINYPAVGAHGSNLLDKTVLSYSGVLSLKAELKKCMKLLVKIRKISGDGIAQAMSFSVNWSSINISLGEWDLIIMDPTQSSDARFIVNGPNSTTIKIEYYEINNSVPSFSKIVTVNP
jgi:hypothetical protein